MTAALADRRPGDVVLSEEGADDPARLTANRVWIVDPLDGTREFGEPGRTDWAVHVALWERVGGGELTAGAVALPAQGHVLSTTTSGEQHQCSIGAAITTPMFHRVEGGGTERRDWRAREGWRDCWDSGRRRAGQDRGEPDASTTLRSEYFRSY